MPPPSELTWGGNNPLFYVLVKKLLVHKTCLCIFGRIAYIFKGGGGGGASQANLLKKAL